MTEAELLRFTMDALSYSGLLHFRVPVGGVAHSLGGGKIIYKKSPMKGFPDVAIVTRQGVLSVLELKSKTGLRPEQKDWIAKLEATNANTCVARTPEEVLQYIERLGGNLPPSRVAKTA